MVPFIKALHSPVLLANVNDTDEPHMKGLYEKSMVIVRSGRKIGIIGLILSTVDVSMKIYNHKSTDCKRVVVPFLN